MKHQDENVMNNENPANEATHDWDEVYARLIASHEGLTEEQSARLNSSLILLMLKHVPELEQIQAYLDESRAFSLVAPLKE
ncbi:DUF2783 domain-containing protein [Thalassomonas sp. RHCl1]|uniref:DUF2783 domain-containing protein n=1 Tax=Thalassomonas sp. RHCl1 TaxID=2995320 RepID=UPI00248C63FE|nr:DUF2783 domain-containing protein [Thalassomonas sp. RHCl1]